MRGIASTKSKAAKILGGTFRANQSPTETADIPVAEDITPPAYLDGYALDCWNKYAPLIKEHKIFTEADFATLEKFCTAYHVYRMAFRELQRSGITISHESRGEIKNPAYDMWKGAMAETRQHGALLGLDPFARSRLDVSTGAETHNPFENL